MAIPQRLKIRRDEDYHTHHIGRRENGEQFMALIGATLAMPLPRNWQKDKRWYAVLHLFDKTGKHLDTKAWLAGTTADGEEAVLERARAKVNEMLKELGRVTYCDIEVGLFSVEIDGSTFGLVDASEPDEGYERVHLLPGNVAFFAPWDGRYDT